MVASIEVDGVVLLGDIIVVFFNLVLREADMLLHLLLKLFSQTSLLLIHLVNDNNVILLTD